MNLRTVTIALIALPILVTIGGAIVVREIQPRLVRGAGSAAAAPVSEDRMQRIAPAASKPRSMRFLRAARQSGTIGPIAKR